MKLFGIGLFIALAFSGSRASAYEISLRFQAEVSEADRARLERIALRIDEIARSQAFSEKAHAFQRYSCLSLSNFPTGVHNVEEAIAFVQTARVEIEVGFFTASPRVVASTSDRSISFNSEVFPQQSDASLANTLFHESLHALDFGHCGKNNIRFFPWIKRSVPYQFGNFVETLFLP